MLGPAARGRDGGAAVGPRAPPMLLSRQVRQGYDHLRQSEGLELAVMQSASGELTPLGSPLGSAGIAPVPSP